MPDLTVKNHRFCSSLRMELLLRDARNVERREIALHRLRNWVRQERRYRIVHKRWFSNDDGYPEAELAVRFVHPDLRDSPSILLQQDANYPTAHVIALSVTAWCGNVEDRECLEAEDFEREFGEGSAQTLLEEVLHAEDEIQNSVEMGVKAEKLRVQWNRSKMRQQLPKLKVAMKQLQKFSYSEEDFRTLVSNSSERNRAEMIATMAQILESLPKGKMSKEELLELWREIGVSSVQES